MNNKIIIILGCGRSGTSLLTNILISSGMSSSEMLNGSSEANPVGAYEDKEIFDTQRKIYDVLGISGYAPISNDKLDCDEIKPLVEKLKSIVRDRIKNSNVIWGFKDPKTASLLALWKKLLVEIDVTAKFVLSVRSPSTVVSSMNKYYDDSYESAEIAWLIRNCEALYEADANCFIVHYEQWFSSQAENMIDGLVRYVGLGKKKVDADLKTVLSEAVDSNLNRMSSTYVVKHPLINKLYDVLRKCNGDAFNRKELLVVVHECMDSINAFSPLLDMGRGKIMSRNESDSLADRNNLKKDNIMLVSREKTFLSEIERLTRSIDNIQISYIKSHELVKKYEKQISHLKKEIFIQKVSVSFRIGQIFVKAVKVPGMNTILLPYNLLKILFEAVLVRKNL